jgi:hypothetical protein
MLQLDVLGEVGDGVLGYDHMHQVLFPLVHCWQVLISWTLAPQRTGEVVIINQLLWRSVHARVDDAALPTVRVGLGDCPVKVTIQVSRSRVVSRGCR